ncbi:MAG: class I SAM-dependent methyltransferase [Planctomycetes bacterium]|nr:class I SAM-dependent methyltransferase [Planctomycetota bacterium]
MSLSNDAKPVPASLYDADYFLHHRGGSDEFLRTQGKEVYHAHRRAMDLARVSPRYTVLDIGCGCGEIVFQCALRGARAVGLDYSADALKLANEARQHYPPEVQSRCGFALADAAHLPVWPRHLDRVFMLDVVEHLTASQLAALCEQAKLAMKPDGLLIIHTFPNLWHSRFLYPVTARIRRLLGQNRPLDPHTERDKLMHVNEQSCRSLKQTLTASGFRCRVWVEVTATGVNGGLESPARRFLGNTYPINLLFGNDIWAVAWT